MLNQSFSPASHLPLLACARFLHMVVYILHLFITCFATCVYGFCLSIYLASSAYSVVIQFTTDNL